MDPQVDPVVVVPEVEVLVTESPEHAELVMIGDGNITSESSVPARPDGQSDNVAFRRRGNHCGAIMWNE